MKKKGALLDFAAERDSALLHAFNTLAAGRKYVQVSDLCQQIVKMPTHRFWVSEERARDIMSAIERRGMDVLHGMRQCKQRMFREIYQRYRLLRLREPSKPVLDLVAEVIYSPAPEFYMDPTYATTRLYRARRHA